MKIIGKQPSREKCAESGWFAWDYLLDEPVEREFILKHCQCLADLVRCKNLI